MNKKSASRPDYTNVVTYLNKRYVNESNIRQLILRYDIPDAELFFIYSYNKSIQAVLPQKFNYSEAKRSRLVYPFKYNILFSIFLMKYGYFQLPLTVFLGILSSMYIIGKLTSRQKEEVKEIITKYSKSNKRYVVPEEKLIPYINLIKKRLK